jgi:hypothetical protein
MLNNKFNELSSKFRNYLLGVPGRTMPPTELAFAVGAEDRRRSSVWKLSLGSDGSIYLMSRMMGSETKVSLHRTGLCQWSRTDAWVKKNLHRGVKNSDRHIVRWQRPIEPPMSATLAFRLIVPASELREIAEEKKLTKVHWLPTPQTGQALAVEMYFTPPTSQEPNASQFPHTPLVVWPLPDLRWFVALFHIEETTPANVATLHKTRTEMIRSAKERKLEILPQYRAVALFENATGYRGMIEMVPSSPRSSD